MKKYSLFTFLFSIITVLVISGCSKDDDNDIENSKPYFFSKEKMLALDISSTTDADALFICNDGSYAIYDSETSSGVGVIQLNSSYKNDINKGMTIVLDENDKPKIASFGNQHIVFNFNGDKFDCAVIDSKGNISYYWDLEMDASYVSDSYASMVMTRADISEETKAKIYYGMKVVSFGITATLTVIAVGAVFAAATPLVIAGAAVAIVALGYQIYKEGVRSQLWGNNIVYGEYPMAVAVKSFDFLDDTSGEIKFKVNKRNLALGFVADLLDDYATNGLENLGNHEDIINAFNNKGNQIMLSAYIVECSSREDTYEVRVMSKYPWEIDDSKVDKKWCDVSKDGNRIVVIVEEYDGMEERICSVRIKTIDDIEEVQPATLTIKQSGVVFQLSAPELVFTQEGGTQAINVYTNVNVDSWEVTSRPDWCRTEEWKDPGALLVTVDEDKYLMEDREGSITLTAKLLNGVTIDRYLTVRQIVQDKWDGTKWDFTGSVNVSGNMAMAGSLRMSQVTNFGIEIRSVDRNDFSLSGDLAGMEQDSYIYLNSEDQLIWSHTETISESGISVNIGTNITFTRTSTTTATGKLYSSTYINVPEFGRMNLQMDGNFSGKRVDMDD